MAFHGATLVQTIIYMMLFMYAVVTAIDVPEIHIHQKHFIVGTTVKEPADTPNGQPKERIELGPPRQYDELRGNIYRVKKIVVDFTDKLEGFLQQSDVQTIQKAYESILGYAELAIVDNVPLNCMPPDHQITDVSVENYMGINGNDQSFLLEYPNTSNFRCIESNFQIINLGAASNLRSLYVTKKGDARIWNFTVQPWTTSLFRIGGPLQDVTLHPCSDELAKLLGEMIPKKVDLMVLGQRVQWGIREVNENNYFGVSIISKYSFDFLEARIGVLNFDFMKLGVQTVLDDAMTEKFLNDIWKWLKRAKRHVRKLFVVVRSTNQRALKKDLQAEGMPQLNHIRLLVLESETSIFGDNLAANFNLVNEIKHCNPKVQLVDYGILKLDPETSVDFSESSVDFSDLSE